MYIESRTNSDAKGLDILTKIFDMRNVLHVSKFFKYPVMPLSYCIDVFYTISPCSN